MRSMTGFGSARAQVGTEDFTVEIRSVNGKFCEVKTRLPRELHALEAELVRTVKARVARGGVDVSVRRGTGASGNLTPRIDHELASRYLESFRSLQQHLGLEGQVSLRDLVLAQGVMGLEEKGIDPEEAKEALERALAEALDGLIAMREIEGAALQADLRSRLHRIEELAGQVSEQAPVAVQHHKDRIAQRVEELTSGIPLDPQRLAQEVALLAERADITEELTRLGSHLAQFHQLLAADEPSGRRMDFLVQELNREVNTVASKSNWAPIATLVVELKAEIERIREQIQNVE